ncbi:3-isopropylmalate dehydratase large subunit [Congzhengia minquanensis]|uniref:3-isopropylmalate dehydratase large subunit n=1 Tax=Congzhengia minquanensis TaxID=2763657 RepID=A0A926DPX8_9FIRM|nr:3-isopropylmalate dehydratase large subunit [Congzhengia minquanensis]MBC8541672.1 3-isopropylmalate dehydratase large subunit [Congzhengia minquanensis]
MGMTITQKILAEKSGQSQVRPGQLIMAETDLVLGNDITAPVAIDEFYKIGCETVFDKTKIALVADHFTPNKDIKSAQLNKKMREFAHRHAITNYFDVGRAGIEHALIPEQGLALPGDLIIGADSHTCTYGALCAFSTGVGSTDMAGAMATGKVWLKVPEAIRFHLTGSLPEFVSGKDLILTIIGQIGVDGALYRSMEFSGSGIASLSMDDRFTVSNMAIEAGAKNGIFPVDEKTEDYLFEHANGKPYCRVAPDKDAEYVLEYEINLSALEPVVALPHLPDNVRKASELGAISIDQAVIGSCTNGRISDLRTAATILSGNHVAVRTIIIPATQEIYLQAVKEGLVQTFIEAGAVVSPPTCGPCLGGHMGVLASGERCVSTTNRNFVGRMGHPDSEVYLASPAVAAQSAIEGKIAVPGRKTI